MTASNDKWVEDRASFITTNFHVRLDIMTSLRAAIARGAEQEREACAEIADEAERNGAFMATRATAQTIAKAIRSRTQGYLPDRGDRTNAP